MTLEKQIEDILDDAFEKATGPTLGGYGAELTSRQDLIEFAVPKIIALIARAPEMAERIEVLKSALAGLITCLDNGIKPDIENIRSLLIESK